MKTPNSVAAGPAISPERLKTLADGVFAIVMTLLVLELGVDTLAVGRQDRDLSDGFAEGKPGIGVTRTSDRSCWILTDLRLFLPEHAVLCAKLVPFLYSTLSAWGFSTVSLTSSSSTGAFSCLWTHPKVFGRTVRNYRTLNTFI